LIIKLHPREREDSYDHWIKAKKIKNLTVKVYKKEHPLELISIANVVCGVGSMMLIEAYLLGIPCLSIQIGSNQPDPFILSRRGLVPRILTAKQLNTRLSSVVKNDKPEYTEADFIGHSINNIIKLIKKLI
jgi:predicted glycosyltransferase